MGVFDVLGFKALRRTLGTAGLYQLYKRGLLPAIQHSAAGRRKMAEVDDTKGFVPDFHAGSLGYRVFSDTVVFYTRDDSFNSFVTIVSSSCMLVQFGFGTRKAPFRGAIAHGDLIDDSQFIIVGTAVEQAYAAEQAQVWAGCILSESCRAFAEARDYISNFRRTHEELANTIVDATQRQSVAENSWRLVKYPVPLQVTSKSEATRYVDQEAYAIDWTIQMFEGAATATFNPSTDSHATRIAENTIAFEQWARANNK